MDRVSNLPDEVLCHVLSFLKTKEAALTSVLAKRWRNLFAFVPNIHIDGSVFLHPEVGKGRRKDIIQSFVNFVDRVLALQGSFRSKKVKLMWETGVDEDSLYFWISNLVVHGVSELDLYLFFVDRRRLSTECFKSRELVKLKLRTGRNMIWSTGSIFLPMLKTLVLKENAFDADTFEAFVHACPALEELDMVGVIWYDSSGTLSSASLQTLRIHSCFCTDTVSFDTPRLVYFDYDDYVAQDYPLVNLKSVLEARINLRVTRDEIRHAMSPNIWLNGYPALQLGSVVKLMNGIRDVQRLHLTPSTLEVLALCRESMPVFNNLKLLCIKSGNIQWQVVPVLLNNCPHLETIRMSLLHCLADSYWDACARISQEDEDPSPSSCPVKILEIEKFRGTMREIQMIRHFLGCFPCLQEIKITDEEYNPAFSDVLKVTDLEVQMRELEMKSLSFNVKLLLCDSLCDKLAAMKSVKNKTCS